MSANMSLSNKKRKPRVVCLGHPKFVGADYLAEFAAEFDYTVLEAATRAEAKALLRESVASGGEAVDAFVVRMSTFPDERLPFDQDFFGELLPAGCRIVASCSAGYSEYPIEWLAQNGVYFTNTVDAVAEATADMAIFLILAVLRNTSNAEKSVRANKWRNGADLVPGRDPSGLTLGIVGMGVTGKHLARKAHAFNMNIIYHNRTRLPVEMETALDVSYCTTLHDLLSKADVVSLHCPLNPQTTNLMGPAEFAAMKHGSFLVNTSRGAVVDEAALKDALESGRVCRAGMDVFVGEPQPDAWFLESDKVVVQPHLGGLTDEAFRRAEKEAFENVRAFFRTGKPNSPVNEPVDLPC